MKNLVSVIIPTFNFAHFIEETIDSVLKQTYKTTEIIVVDDGSTDKTQSVLKKYVSLPNFRLITSANSGAPIARNRGVLANQSGGSVYIPSPFFLNTTKFSSKAFRASNFSIVPAKFKN